MIIKVGVILRAMIDIFVQRVATHLFTYIGNKIENSTTIGQWLMLPDLDQALNEMEKFNETILKKNL